MSRHRFFLAGQIRQSPAGDPVVLPLAVRDAHHAIDVLRVTPGEEVIVVEPHGRAYVVAVESVTGREIEARVVSELEGRASGPRITLIQGVCKGATMDAIVQHAVELGVERIVPFVAERTIVRFDAEKAQARKARWERIAEGAARQSQQVRIPVIDAPVTLDRALPIVAGFDTALVMWEESSGPGIAQALADAVTDGGRAAPSVTVVIGPEGGLTADEVGVLKSAGAVECSLGPDILRAETAALVAVALVAHTLGGLGNEGVSSRGTSPSA